MTDNDGTCLPNHWRNIRYTTTIVILALGLLFVSGSVLPEACPMCCTADFGGSCTSCGITRSVRAVLHGDLERAATFHQGGVYLVAFIALMILFRPVPFLFPSPRVIAADFFVFVIGWILLAIVFFGLPGFGYNTYSHHKGDTNAGDETNSKRMAQTRFIEVSLYQTICSAPEPYAK